VFNHCTVKARAKTEESADSPQFCFSCEIAHGLRVRGARADLGILSLLTEPRVKGSSSFLELRVLREGED
jgi:hypothetical protein